MVCMSRQQIGGLSKRAGITSRYYTARDLEDIVLEVVPPGAGTEPTWRLAKTVSTGIEYFKALGTQTDTRGAVTRTKVLRYLCTSHGTVSRKTHGL